MRFPIHALRQGLTTVALPLLLWAAAPLSAQAAPLLSVQLTSASVAVGGNVDAVVQIEQVDDLYAYQFDLRFSPATLGGGGPLAEGSFLQTMGGTLFDGGLVDNTGGTVSFVLASLIGATPGASTSGAVGELARFSMTALSAGLGVVSIENVLLLDSSLLEIGGVTLQRATLQISGGNGGGNVPEPGTAWLVLLAAGLAWPCRGLRSTAP